MRTLILLVLTTVAAATMAADTPALTFHPQAGWPTLPPNGAPTP